MICEVVPYSFPSVFQLESYICLYRTCKLDLILTWFVIGQEWEICVVGEVLFHHHGTQISYNYSIKSWTGCELLELLLYFQVLLDTSRKV